MIARIDSHWTNLEISLYKSDLPQLYRGEIIRAITTGKFTNLVNLRLCNRSSDERDLEIVEMRLVQGVLPIDPITGEVVAEDYLIHGYCKPEELAILGYNIRLDEKKFMELVEAEKRRPINDSCPFWGRGIQYGCALDRIHINYIHLMGKKAEKLWNPLATNPNHPLLDFYNFIRTKSEFN